MSPEAVEALRKIKLLALDVDGVLTGGGVYVAEDGSEFRRFNIKDGLGLKRLAEAGIIIVWISGGTVEAIRHRAHHLGVRDVYLGIEDKAALLKRICRDAGISLEEAAFMGDDINDLAVLEMVGFSAAPQDAVIEVRSRVRLVTQAVGGGGAVRELCDAMLLVH